MIESIRKTVRQGMQVIAHALNSLSGGKITPNMVSVVSLLGHVLIAWTLYRGLLPLSGLLVIVFGLMDALDGALARLQNKAAAAGMLLDASSDRVKEGLLYFGLAAYFLQTEPPLNPWKVLICIVALSGSMLVSYVKAKGETALTDKNLTANEKNRALQDGFFRYEVRMAMLVIGLFASSYIFVALVVISLFSWYTAADRFNRIYKRLS